MNVLDVFRQSATSLTPEKPTQDRDTLKVTAELRREKRNLVRRCSALESEKANLERDLKKTTEDLKAQMEKTVGMLDRTREELEETKSALQETVNELAETRNLLKEMTEELQGKTDELKETTDELERFMRRADVGLNKGNQVEATPICEAGEHLGSPQDIPSTGPPASEESDTRIRRTALRQELLKGTRLYWAQFVEIVQELQLEDDELLMKSQALRNEEEELKEELEHLRKERKDVWRELGALRDRKGGLQEQLEVVQEQLSHKPPRKALQDRELRLSVMLAEVHRSISEREGWLGVDLEGEEPSDDCWHESSSQARGLLATLEEKAATSELLRAEKDRVVERRETLQAQELELYQLLLTMARILGENGDLPTSLIGEDR